MRGALGVVVSVGLGLGGSPAFAQLTLDQRIRKAAEAQAAKEAALSVSARPSVPSVTPTVSLSGVDIGRAAAGAPPKPDRFELVLIRGFLDVPNGLEAAIVFNGVRHIVTLDQPQLAEGWRLASITQDGVELTRGSTNLTLRFGTAAAVPVAGHDPSARPAQPAQVTPHAARRPSGAH